MEKTTRGGKRIGSGRKPSGTPNRVSVSYRLAPEVVAYLRSTPSATEAIEQAVRRSKGFRERGNC